MKRGKLMLVKPEPEPVRFSRLKRMNRSPAHYLDGGVEETGSMRKGTALHAYMLGGADKVVVYTGGNRDDRIEKWREFKAEHAGKHIVIPSELRAVEGMRRSLERHPRALDLLDDGVQETRIAWSYKGRACAGTPDVCKPKGSGTKRLVELKTDQSSAPWEFKWKARKMSYHAQVAWYADGLGLCSQYQPGPVDEVYIVVVESSAPYPVTVIDVAECILEQGRIVWRPWFDELLECERRQKFPAYVDGDVRWTADENDVGLEWGTTAAE